MSITIDLPDEMTQRITASADRAGMTPSEYIADSVRRRLAIEEFHEMRIISFAPKARIGKRFEVWILPTHGVNPLLDRGNNCAAIDQNGFGHSLADTSP